jgi:hypothetical protein
MSSGGNDGFEEGGVNPILSVQVLLKFGDVFVTSTCYSFTKCGTHVVTAVGWWNCVQTDISRCRIKNWKQRSKTEITGRRPLRE